MTTATPSNRLPFDVSKLIRICRNHHVTMLGLFGSMARGEATETSDIDLVVRFGKPTSLVTTIALEQQLAHEIGRPIDILTEASISPYLRENIYHDLQVLYEAE
jgi:uncharacterized protein